MTRTMVTGAMGMQRQYINTQPEAVFMSTAFLLLKFRFNLMQFVFARLFSEPTTSLVHELPVSENIVKTIGDDLKQTTIDEMMANPEDSDEATTTLVEFTDPHNNLDYSFQIPALPPLPASHAQTVRRSTRRRMTVDERPRTVPTRQSARISMRRQTITEPIPVVVASTPATKTRGKPKEHSSNTG